MYIDLKELIELLQEILDEYGDQPVFDTNFNKIEKVEFHDVQPWPYVLIE